MVALGINVLQPLPSMKWKLMFRWGTTARTISRGHSLRCFRAGRSGRYLATINRLLAAKGIAPMGIQDITSGPAQLKALVDRCHLYGIAVAFDIVYNQRVDLWAMIKAFISTIAPPIPVITIKVSTSRIWGSQAVCPSPLEQ